MKCLLLLLLVSSVSFASELTTRYQYWWLKGPDVKSWRQDLESSIDIKPGHSLLLRATHFERFHEQDHLANLGWRFKNSQGHFEFNHTQGDGNKILAIRDTQATHGRALGNGYSGWVTLKAQGFHTSDVYMANLGLEKEWEGGWFAVPSLSVGRSSYHKPADTKDVWGTQLRVGKYREEAWKYFAYAAIAEEAQALAVTNQARPLKVTTYGAGAEWYLRTQLRLGLMLERAYYPAINTRFESVMANLTWNWGQR